ncbi:unnamed protein product [Paramecium pentaurelia]|uniref:Cyclic nucleotide-binding domain-containing protein n=1 Tax=Paramecium pentaurelia TaxID=43138 RepID=A0A8S1URU9_9CILI|nr:unnamed protein product [Paramecium pentaurelia]
MNKIYSKPLDETCDNPQLHEATKMFLTMNKENHTRDELHYILQRMEELPYFKQFVSEKLQKGTQRNDILELCSRLRVEYFKGGEVLFQENDTSNDKLYMIQYGEVMLMRQKKMDQLMSLQRQNSEQVQQTQLKMAQILNAKKFTNKIIRHHNIHKETTISKEEKQQLEHQYGESIRLLGVGTGFGEKALVENIPRSLTVACYSHELFVIVLKKDDFITYQMTFEKTKKEKQQLMFKIFKNVNNEYSSQRLESMIYSCQTITYDRGTQLATEDDDGDVFYLVINGDLTLHKRIDNRNVSLCIISQGHLIGEEIIINKTGTYEYSCIVTSLLATVIVIDANEFIHKFPEECRLQLIEDYGPKTANRQRLLQLLLQKRKTQNSLNKELTNDQVRLLTEIDNVIIDQNKIHIVESFKKQKDIQLNQHFLTKYSNPSVQNFCIAKIIDREKTFHKLIKSCEFQEFDFGNGNNDIIKRRRFMLENKLNLKKSHENYLKPQFHILPLTVKRDLVKNFRVNNKKSVCYSNFNITTLQNVQKNKKQSTLKIKELVTNRPSQQQFDSYSTHMFTQIDDRQSL